MSLARGRFHWGRLVIPEQARPGSTGSLLPADRATGRRGLAVFATWAGAAWLNNSRFLILPWVEIRNLATFWCWQPSASVPGKGPPALQLS